MALRVLYIHSVGAFGGAARSLWELVRSFPEGAVEVRIVLPRGPVDAFFEQRGYPVLRTAGLSRFDNTRYGHYRRLRWLMLLHWEGRDSMAHSIEARVPFLDYRLVEFTLGLPEEQKLSAGITKRVLRDAMRGVLPEDIRTRMDKIGFATAEEHWLRERPDAFRLAMQQATDASQGILRSSALRMLEGVIAGTRPFSNLPWRMISFGAWMPCFGVALP